MSTHTVPIVVFGAGSWGTALANVLQDAGNSPVLWGRDASTVKEINERHTNEKYVKGLRLNPQLRASSDFESLIAQSPLIVCSIPTQQVRNVFKNCQNALKRKIVVNTAKGIEVGTHLRVEEVFHEICSNIRYASISGPSFAHEVIQRLPTAVTVASKDQKIASQLQSLLSTPYFRAYTSEDVVGVELAGALKNVIAIASGVVHGLSLGYNAQAALINRGIAEISRLGKRCGADPMTFLGLAGMGDLVLTCTGPLSRNRKLGTLLAQGKTLHTAQTELGGVAEGAFTARSAMELARALHVEMPIVEQVYGVLYEGVTPQEALAGLMSRDLKAEWE